MDEVTVRPARDDDYEAFVGLFPELGIPDPVPERDAWGRERLDGSLIAEQGGATLGYLWFEQFADVGHVRTVIVSPEARGRGVGRLLMRAAAERMHERGATTWRLNVKPDNAAAIRLYEALGMQPTYRSTVVRLTWERAGALPVQPGARARPIEPGDDRAAETAMHLLPGQLDGARQKGGRHLVQLREAGRVVGVSVFDPRFPGAFPFRLGRPELAGALLAALEPLSLPEYDFVQLVVEDDAPLADYLLDAGAARVLEIVHYRGTLPAE